MTDHLAKLAAEMRKTFDAAIAARAHSIRNPNDPAALHAAIAACCAEADAHYAYYRASLEAEAEAAKAAKAKH